MSKLAVLIVMMGALGTAGWPVRSTRAAGAQKLAPAYALIATHIGGTRG